MAKSESTGAASNGNRKKVGGVGGHKWKDGEPVIGRVDAVATRKTKFGERLVAKMTGEDGQPIVLYLPLTHEDDINAKVGRKVKIEREGRGFDTNYYYTDV